jgi:hypothetical protein
MTRTSRARTSEASLNVVEPTPNQHEHQEPPAQEPPAVVENNEAPPQPDGAGDASPDIDAAMLQRSMAGMAMLLRVALRLMKSYDAIPERPPARRDRKR